MENVIQCQLGREHSSNCHFPFLSPIIGVPSPFVFFPKFSAKTIAYRTPIHVTPTAICLVGANSIRALKNSSLFVIGIPHFAFNAHFKSTPTWQTNPNLYTIKHKET